MTHQYHDAGGQQRLHWHPHLILHIHSIHIFSPLTPHHQGPQKPTPAAAPLIDASHNSQNHSHSLHASQSRNQRQASSHYHKNQNSPHSTHSLQQQSNVSSSSSASSSSKSHVIPLYIDLRHPNPYSSLVRRISVLCVSENHSVHNLDIFHDLGYLEGSEGRKDEDSVRPSSAASHSTTETTGSSSSQNCVEEVATLNRMNAQSLTTTPTARPHVKETSNAAVSIALRYDKKIKMGVHTLYDLSDMNALYGMHGEIQEERSPGHVSAGDHLSQHWNCREKCLVFASRWVNKAIEMRIRIYKKYPLYMRISFSSEFFDSLYENMDSSQNTNRSTSGSKNSLFLNYNFDERNLTRKETSQIHHHQVMKLPSQKSDGNNSEFYTHIYPVANTFSIELLDQNASSAMVPERGRQIIVHMEDLTNAMYGGALSTGNVSDSHLPSEYKIRIRDGDMTRIYTVKGVGETCVSLKDLNLHFENPSKLKSNLHNELPLHPNPPLPAPYSNENIYAYPSLIPKNRIEILIDGLQTFSRYYHYMMQAQKTIHIIGWELSLSFGLVYLPTQEDPTEVKTNILHLSNLKKFLRKHNLWPQDSPRRWITLQDVLLAKAAQGVKTKIIVWRHNFISMLGRFLYMGEFTIEREVEKLKKKAATMNIRVEALHYSVPLSPDSIYADPYSTDYDADIVVLIVGNPKGIVSCCHEKMVLVDADLPARCVAFTGGFDIARGRFDQPKHLPPKPLFEWRSLFRSDQEERYSGKEVQPFFRLIRMLWHDSQVMIQGPATRTLYLHFAQRWIQSFHFDLNVTRNLKLPPTPLDLGEPFKDPQHTDVHPCFIREAPVRIFRQWPTVLQTHVLLDHFCSLIKRAKRYIYIEHQYPFHSFALAHCMCEALRQNPNLKVIVIAPVKTDLPNGFIGSLLDISSDHIVNNLNMIYRAAPDRFAAYGIVRQEPTTKSLKAVYVHSKLMICDDEIISIGSSNLDYLSFSQSSEITLEIYNRDLCIDTKLRLFEEHLEDFYDRAAFVNNFDAVFETFQKVARLNYESFRSSGQIVGRLFSMVPHKYYLFALGSIHVPSIIVKTLFKFGLTPDVIRKYLPIPSMQCCRRRAKKNWIRSRL